MDEEEIVHDASFSTRGTVSAPESPDRPVIRRTEANVVNMGPSGVVDDRTLGGDYVFDDMPMGGNFEKDSRHLIMVGPSGPPKPGTGATDDKKPDGEDKQSKARTTIEQAKDRAQITAATSMSIVHVALLKDTLDAGPDSTKYYDWMLGFIIAALLLQVLAGILALYVALLRSYYTEYKDDFLADCWKICCPCTCKRRSHKHYDMDSWFEDEDDEADENSNNKQTPNQPGVSGNQPKSKQPAKSKRHESDDCQQEPGCCPWECTTANFDDFDTQILDLYDIWSEKAIKADIQCANIEAAMRSITADVNKARTELIEWEATEHEERNRTADKKVLDHINARLTKAQATRAKLEAQMKEASKLKAQGEVLRRYVTNIEKEKVLKRATFWQNCLNMMLYLVFVLNAVIVGFGLATRETVNGSTGSNSSETA